MLLNFKFDFRSYFVILEHNVKFGKFGRFALALRVALEVHKELAIVDALSGLIDRAPHLGGVLVLERGFWGRLRLGFLHGLRLGFLLRRRRQLWLVDHRAALFNRARTLRDLRVLLVLHLHYRLELHAARHRRLRHGCVVHFVVHFFVLFRLQKNVFVLTILINMTS